MPDPLFSAAGRLSAARRLNRPAHEIADAEIAVVLAKRDRLLAAADALDAEATALVASATPTEGK